MCKLFAIVEIEDESRAEKFAQKAIPFITKDDHDGLGIMRLGERGVHVQRWLEPPTVIRRKESAALWKYRKALRHQQDESGVVSNRLYSIAVHGRFATCTKSLENTHPFRRDGSVLMHNGVISNAHKFPRPLSTCDSEALLSQYLTHNVRTNSANLSQALDGVGGYYAAIVFNDSGEIDIFRDGSAALHIAHVRGIGVVIATTADIINRTAKKCRAYITGMDEILPCTSIRWIDGLNPRVSTFTARKPVEVVHTVPDTVRVVYDRPSLSELDAMTDEEWQDKKAIDHLRGIDKEWRNR